MSVKRITFLRHGRSTMNDYTCVHDIRESDFVDPMILDARLTKDGIEEARIVREDKATESTLANVGMIVCSPLTRAIETANITTQGLVTGNCKKIVCELLSERLYSSGDVGRKKSELIADKISEGWDFSLVNKETWWYEYNEARDGEYIDFRKGLFQHHAEMKHVFTERLTRLKQFLLAQNEEHILVVGHRLVFYGLTGRKFHNAELVTIEVTDLPKHVAVDY